MKAQTQLFVIILCGSAVTKISLPNVQVIKIQDIQHVCCANDIKKTTLHFKIWKNNDKKHLTMSSFFFYIEMKRNLIL